MALHFAYPRPCLVLPSTSEMNKGNIMCCVNDTSNLKFKVKAEGSVFKNKVTDQKRPELFKDWKLPSGNINENIYEIFNGRLQERVVYQQNFPIRSYQIGCDHQMSIEALINILQESSMTHFKTVGLHATPGMIERNLVWVVHKLQIVVDSYPSWTDVVRVDTWASAAEIRFSGRRDWLCRDYKTQKTVCRAVRYMMMNVKTRKISRYIEKVKDDSKELLLENKIMDEDDRKLRDLNLEAADYVRTDLSSQWTDLDTLQHVNHARYAGWILESIPNSVLESHELCALTLEFRKECGSNTSLLSLSTVSKEADKGVELDHSLRLENGSELLRGRTIWRPRDQKFEAES